MERWRGVEKKILFPVRTSLFSCLFGLLYLVCQFKCGLNPSFNVAPRLPWPVLTSELCFLWLMNPARSLGFKPFLDALMGSEPVLVDRRDEQECL